MTSMDSPTPTDIYGTLNFRQIFESLPHPYLILLATPDFEIGAVSDSYLTATGTQRDAIIGRPLFDVFPDNPDDATASGTSDLRSSLERVLHDRVKDVMGIQKYDIPRDDSFEVKYWSPVNTPLFNSSGNVVAIIHHVEDVTEFVLLRERAQQPLQ
ncbi:double histidine kinase dhkd, putative, partial [Ricinus communis]